MFLQTIIQRLKWAGADWNKVTSPETLLVVASFDESKSFGVAVMWAYTLLLLAAESQERISLTKLSDFFPWGIPVEAEIERAWDAQKCRNMGIPGDNYLDQYAAWAPLAAAVMKDSDAPAEPKPETEIPYIS
jgi:hypothetical protein